MRQPTWLTQNSPVFFLSFGKSLGGTLSFRDAKKLLAQSSKNMEERRHAWFRAKTANAIFAKDKKNDPERVLLEEEKKLLESLGLDVPVAHDEPTDLSLVIANDFGRCLRMVARQIETEKLEGKRGSLHSNPEAKMIAEAALFHVLLMHDERLVHKFKDKWHFAREDLINVQETLRVEPSKNM